MILLVSATSTTLVIINSGIFFNDTDNDDRLGNNIGSNSIIGSNRVYAQQQSTFTPTPTGTSSDC